MEIMEDSKSFEILRNAFEQQLINDGFVEHSGYSLEKNHINAYIDERVECAWFACLQGYRLAKTQAVPEWISTSDRMPEEGEEVLVHNLGQVRQVTRDSKWAGGFKERNCYGWQAAYSQSHWMPKSIELPEEYHFYYKNDAKQAQEQSHE